jgi:acyl carrier protein
MTTLDQITQLIHDRFDIDRSILEPDRPLADYGLDSLALAELLFTIEDEFKIQFPERSEHIDTLQQLAASIDALRAAQSA